MAGARGQYLGDRQTEGEPVRGVQPVPRLELAKDFQLAPGRPQTG